MSTLAAPMVLAALVVSAVCIAALILAVRHRWFSRVHGGFQWALILGLVGLGVLSSILVGVWGYAEASVILQHQVILDLENVGGITEQQFRRRVAEALQTMEKMAQDWAPAVASKNMNGVIDRMRQVEEINPLFLQLRLTDDNSRILVELSRTGEIEPMNRVAAATSLEGGSFATDPYLSPTFKRFVLNLSVPVRTTAGAVIGTLGARLDIQEALSQLISTARFNVSGYAVIVNHDGRILAHPDPARVNDDISMYPAVQRGLLGQTGSVTSVNKAGLSRLMFYKSLQGPGTSNPRPLVLLSEISASEVEAELRTLRYKFLAAVLLVGAGGVLVALQLAGSFKRPLNELVRLTHEVEKGDFSHKADLTGEDEMGQLARSFNHMVGGLQERERVKSVFGQYVATQISEKVLQGEVNLGGESRVVTILFSDIRSFTAMSEEMTPTQVVAFLNEYFSEMVEAVFEQGGVLDKFIGDGLMAVFGAFGESADHASRAVHCALRMKSRLAKINGERGVAGKPPIVIGIGIHTDEVILGNIGSQKRLQYTAIGDGVNTCSRVQTLNKEFGTTILVTEHTYERIKDEFTCRMMPAAQIRGKEKAITFYEVVSTAA